MSRIRSATYSGGLHLERHVRRGRGRVARLENWGAHAHTGVVDEDVHLPERLQRPVGDLAGGVGIGHIERQGDVPGSAETRASRRSRRPATATTRAPRSCASRAVASPVPEDAPVTTTTLPVMTTLVGFPPVSLPTCAAKTDRPPPIPCTLPGDAVLRSGREDAT